MDDRVSRLELMSKGLRDEVKQSVSGIADKVIAHSRELENRLVSLDERAGQMESSLGLKIESKFMDVSAQLEDLRQHAR